MKVKLIALLFGFAAFAVVTVADEADQKRLQKLEDSVRQLQQENSTLKKRVEELEGQKPGTYAKSPADPGTPETTAEKIVTPFVLPWGKESKLVLGGYLHMNGELGDVSAFEGRLAEGPNQLRSRARIRRARINVSGEFWENFDFKLEGDFEQSDGLSSNRTGFSASDLFINWHQFPEFNVKVGQFKAPFGLEQLTPDPFLFTIERSLVTTALTPERQIGLQIWGKPLARVFPDHKDVFSYALGAFNGNGRNIAVNDNSQFMLAGRLGSQVFQGKLFGQDTQWKLGINGVYSRDAANTNLSPAGNLKLQADGSLLPFSTHSADQREALGVDQWFTFGNFDLIAEGMEERLSPTDATPNFSAFTAWGYYVQPSYYFWNKKLQLVAKWEYFNPDQASHDDLYSITSGFNYYIKGDHIKLMLDYIHTWSQFRNHNPSLGQNEFDEAILRLQLMF